LLDEVTSGSGFKDHFSDQSAGYARHRPHYPESLFDYLSALTSGHACAWDCATGSGQAAIALAHHYEQVIATDASAAQIGSALPHDSVDYHVAKAEASGLDADSVDLVTVGQALHWFDTERFSSEATRVLVGGGVLAAWCYELCKVEEGCDGVVDHLYADLVGDYWPPERRLIENRYADIALPGEPIEPPDFDMRVTWQVEDMLGYLRTWSACQRYERQQGSDPVDSIEADLVSAWGKERRAVAWPLTLRVSRVH
jgi:SAM-dependent methyltransferase